jgi:hypothetical protein
MAVLVHGRRKNSKVLADWVETDFSEAEADSDW